LPSHRLSLSHTLHGTRRVAGIGYSVAAAWRLDADMACPANPGCTRGCGSPAASARRQCGDGALQALRPRSRHAAGRLLRLTIPGHEAACAAARKAIKEREVPQHRANQETNQRRQCSTAGCSQQSAGCRSTQLPCSAFARAHACIQQCAGDSFPSDNKASIIQGSRSSGGAFRACATCQTALHLWRYHESGDPSPGAGPGFWCDVHGAGATAEQRGGRIATSW
jgi:hypothetical protein